VKKYKKNNVMILTIGNRVRKRRIAKGWTMMDLAYEAEMDYRQIGRIERGEVNFTIGTLLKICKVIDIKLKDLVK
jgi:transcriptional regulator with XRE-family HTH domain